LIEKLNSISRVILIIEIQQYKYNKTSDYDKDMTELLNYFKSIGVQIIHEFEVLQYIK